jgi:hypothetical protein
LAFVELQLSVTPSPALTVDELAVSTTDGVFDFFRRPVKERVMGIEPTRV